MATFKGNDGVVLIGTDVMAEVISFSVDETADTIEDTVMGDTAKTYKASFTDFTATVETYFDDTDAAQQAVTAGDSVTLKLQMEGNTSGDHQLTGTALVTSRSIGVTSDGINTATYSLQGTGGLTETTV
eukprot:GHVR01050333.1.p1 GENE.GHVR01050333.1~~GHVR01050333.1.p1  ORF type:complete len:129 (-),score=20.79 GHVR01050333.1:752-1138(-)